MSQTAAPGAHLPLADRCVAAIGNATTHAVADGLAVAACRAAAGVQRPGLSERRRSA
jgi:hypothetical protein